MKKSLLKKLGCSLAALGMCMGETKAAVNEENYGEYTANEMDTEGKTWEFKPWSLGLVAGGHAVNTSVTVGWNAVNNALLKDGTTRYADVVPPLLWLYRTNGRSVEKLIENGMPKEKLNGKPMIELLQDYLEKCDKNGIIGELPWENPWTAGTIHAILLSVRKWVREQTTISTLKWNALQLPLDVAVIIATGLL